jgi:hypothetical protein
LQHCIESTRKSFYELRERLAGSLSEEVPEARHDPAIRPTPVRVGGSSQIFGRLDCMETEVDALRCEIRSVLRRLEL